MCILSLLIAQKDVIRKTFSSKEKHRGNMVGRVAKFDPQPNPMPNPNPPPLSLTHNQDNATPTESLLEPKYYIVNSKEEMIPLGTPTSLTREVTSSDTA